MNMLPNEYIYISFPWMEWYPQKGEEWYDGVHDGDFKGHKENAHRNSREKWIHQVEKVGRYQIDIKKTSQK
jgi:hypothetical protein